MYYRNFQIVISPGQLSTLNYPNSPCVPDADKEKPLLTHLLLGKVCDSVSWTSQVSRAFAVARNKFSNVLGSRRLGERHWTAHKKIITSKYNRVVGVLTSTFMEETGQNESIRTIVSPHSLSLTANPFLPLGCIFWRNCDRILIILPWHLHHSRDWAKNLRCSCRPVLPCRVPYLSIRRCITQTRAEYPHCRYHPNVFILHFVSWYNGVYMGQHAQICGYRSDDGCGVACHGVLDCQRSKLR